MNDTNSLALTKWNCKYHIVFVPNFKVNLQNPRPSGFGGQKGNLSRTAGRLNVGRSALWRMLKETE